MWPASQRFFDTLARSHRQMCYVEVLQDGYPVATLDALTLPDASHGGSLMRVVGGSILVDRAKVRRSGTIDLLDVAGAVDASVVDELFPLLRTELRVWVGVRYYNAPDTGSLRDPVTTEYVPVATLVVAKKSGAYPRVTLTGFDRMWLVGQFTTQYAIASGTPVSDAISNILALQVPGSRLDTSGILDTEFTTPKLLYAEQDDASDKTLDLAAAAGMMLYADPMGAFTTASEPSTDDPPVMTYTAGVRSMMMRPSPEVDATDAKNAVVFTGEGTTGPPVRGYAQDDDPTSPTYVGAVGVRPYFASSPLITTTLQAELAAKTRLNNILGFAAGVTVPGLPNPALDAGDVLYVTDPTQNLYASVIVDSFPVNVQGSAGEQVLTCRAQVVR